MTNTTPKPTQMLLVLAMIIGAVLVLAAMVILALETVLGYGGEVRMGMLGLLGTGVASLFGGALKYKSGGGGT